MGADSLNPIPTHTDTNTQIYRSSTHDWVNFLFFLFFAECETYMAGWLAGCLEALEPFLEQVAV